MLEAQVENGGAPYTYTVDWEDGSEPESGRSTASSLELSHDYDLISSFQVRLTVTLGERDVRLEPLLVTVGDDDDDRAAAGLEPPAARGPPRVSARWSAGRSRTRAGSTRLRRGHPRAAGPHRPLRNAPKASTT